MNVTVVKSGKEPAGKPAGKPSVAPGVRLGGMSFVWRPRIVLVTLLLAAAAFLAFCLSIAVGTSPSACRRWSPPCSAGASRSTSS